MMLMCTFTEIDLQDFSVQWLVNGSSLDMNNYIIHKTTNSSQIIFRTTSFSFSGEYSCSLLDNIELTASATVDIQPGKMNFLYKI